MKPRNMLAVHAHFRKAGAHGKSNKAIRQAQKRHLRKEVAYAY